MTDNTLIDDAEELDDSQLENVAGGVATPSGWTDNPTIHDALVPAGSSWHGDVWTDEG